MCSALKFRATEVPRNFKTDIISELQITQPFPSSLLIKLLPEIAKTPLKPTQKRRTLQTNKHQQRLRQGLPSVSSGSPNLIHQNDFPFTLLLQLSTLLQSCLPWILYLLMLLPMLRRALACTTSPFVVVLAKLSLYLTQVLCCMSI